MNEPTFTVRVKGREVQAPCRHIEGLIVFVLGKWLRIARIDEEEWTEGQIVKDPESFVAKLRKERLKADLFTFVQKPPENEAKFPYHIEWDNYAVIHLSSFEDWWENQLPQESRKNVRRSAKRGVIVKRLDLDDNLVAGITQIYNETSIRQGKRFPHYGKGFDAVKREVSTMLDRSEFIGAYFGTELIGFIKLVYMGKVASILHIVSKNEHYDKRPTNALISKAVEMCAERGVGYLLYGRYTYGNKATSPLAEFKRRNGFQEMAVPRYFVPLTLWGRIATHLRLYRGLLGLLPARIVVVLVGARARWLQTVARLKARAKPDDAVGGAEKVEDGSEVGDLSKKDRPLGQPASPVS